MEIDEYILDLLKNLADTDPATGQMQVDEITVSDAYKLYKADFDELGDCAHLPSERTFGRCWKRVVEKHKFSIRCCKTMSKCEACIQLRSTLKKVSFFLLSISFIFIEKSLIPLHS
jgi:hypothetical protein